MAMHRQDLSEKLSQAQPFLIGQNFIPILNHFCFDGDSVTAYNDVAGVRLSLETDLHCAIPGSVLLNLLNTMSSETVSIESQKQQIQVKAGRTKVTLPTLASNEFVFKVPDLENTFTFDLPTSLLVGLSKCLSGVSQDFSHPEITGVTWHINNTGVTLYSTDNATLSKYTYTQPNFWSDELTMIIPRFFCEQLVTLAKVYADTTFKLHFGPDFVVAELGEHGLCLVFTRVISNKALIDFEKAITANLEDGTESKSFIAQSLELEKALDRAGILLKLSMLDQFSNAEMNNGTLKITTTSPYGDSVDFLEMPGMEGHYQFTFNPKLWSRGLKIAPLYTVLPRIIAMQSEDKTFLHLIAHAKR